MMLSQKYSPAVISGIIAGKGDVVTVAVSSELVTTTVIVSVFKAFLRKLLKSYDSRMRV